MSSIDEVVRKILERRANIPDTRSLLVGVSGIDGCGKGYLATQLQAHLALHGVIPAILNGQSKPAPDFPQRRDR
jgi:uridine kinase